MRHEPWLHLYSEAELEAELASAEAHIVRATGRRPMGFRGPGFSVSATTLRVLARRGYAYDASTLPSFIGPLARAYYLATGRFNAEQRERLSRLFGGWRDGFQPLKPFAWKVDDRMLLELPVTTFPLFRVPIHLSYVHFLAGRSPGLALAYFRAALAACRLARIEPSVLLHPLDFLGGDDVPSLRFFPAMNTTTKRKVEIVERCFDALARHHAVRTMAECAADVAARRRVPQRALGAHMEQHA
jgi:peptidoglycan/xylan/chitin deacetylase (PgdA/CDA1 family)